MEYYSSLDASQLDADSPTLFELISSNQLEALLSPSLRYVLVHYTAKYPKYLLRIANRFDEINVSLRVLIEWYFLHYWQGLFTENFYGIKRVNQTRLHSSKLSQLVPSKVEERRRLTNLQIIVSIFEVVGTSYICEKLTYCYEVWYPKYLTDQLKPKDPSDKLDVLKTEAKIKFVQLFPYIQSSIRAGNFITTLMYLAGASKSPSLLTYLFKINYSRLNAYDYDLNDPEKIKKSKGSTPHNKIRPPSNLEYLLRLVTKHFTNPTWNVVKIVLGTFFPVAIFSLKFLEWWSNSGFTQKFAKSLGSVLETLLPPPSAISKKREQQVHPKKAYKSGNSCPLCKQEISNPAIIETGYVFCYSCIYSYLSESHKVKKKASSEASDVDSESDEEEEDEKEKRREAAAAAKIENNSNSIDVFKGGRCPVTGKKLLGCKWNSLKQEWDIEGIRRLIF